MVNGAVKMALAAGCTVALAGAGAVVLPGGQATGQVTGQATAQTTVQASCAVKPPATSPPEQCLAMTDPDASGLAIWGVRGGPPGGTPETEWYDYLGQPIATMGQSGGFKVYGDQICVYPGGDVFTPDACLRDNGTVTVGLLRDDEEGPSLAPAPGVGNLEELAGTVRAAGIPVTLAVTGDVTALPPAASLTAYRIVQEALTNVVKHAPGATATARVRASRDGVLITVDNGRGTGAPGPEMSRPGGGARHGLVGMTERAAAFGGTLDAGPAAGGGFQVTAFLPLASPAASGPVGQVA